MYVFLICDRYLHCIIQKRYKDMNNNCNFIHSYQDYAARHTNHPTTQHLHNQTTQQLQQLHNSTPQHLNNSTPQQLHKSTTQQPHK
jgi:hypothetical protein